jgi:hypothetical protein
MSKTEPSPLMSKNCCGYSRSCTIALDGAHKQRLYNSIDYPTDMNYFLKTALLALAVTLTGCATTQSTGTYSGDAKATLKEAGSSVGAFVRQSLSRPMPAREPAPSTSVTVVDKSSAPKGPPPSAAAPVSTNGVEVYSVAPAGTTTPNVSLTNGEPNLKDPSQTGNRN